MFTITPRAISKEIEKLCRDLVKDPRPVFLPVTPVAHAEVVECFPAIERQIREQGGSICYGWQIWEWPGVMIEAEFHGVWKDPGGVLRDITPKQQPTSQILFLPDPVKIYEEKQVRNVRRPLSPDPAIKAYISATEAEYELMNRGDRANQHGEITLEDDEALEMAEIRRRQMDAFLELSQRQPGRNDPCHCGSGKKYKKCHG